MPNLLLQHSSGEYYASSSHGDFFHNSKDYPKRFTSQDDIKSHFKRHISSTFRIGDHSLTKIYHTIIAEAKNYKLVAFRNQIELENKVNAFSKKYDFATMLKFEFTYQRLAYNKQGYGLSDFYAQLTNQHRNNIPRFLINCTLDGDIPNFCNELLRLTGKKFIIFSNNKYYRKTHFALFKKDHLDLIRLIFNFKQFDYIDLEEII